MPPPPPPPPGPPPPPLLPAAPPVGGAVDPKNRNLLLQSIRAGTTLKKTVTKDRSAPIISRKSVVSPSDDSDRRHSNFRTGSATIDRTNGLAGLFSEGMPKLKPIGINLGQPQTGSLSSLPTVNVSSLHNNNTSHNAPVRTEHHIKRTVDPKNRGPPPPAPTQKPVFPTSASDSTLTVGPGSHVRSQSNVSLPNGTRSGKPSSKPQLAPKPPAPAPPRKLPTRTQSMRAPASPPVLPPNASAPSFTLPTNELNNRTQPAFHASIDSLLLRGRPRTKPPPPPRSAVPPPPPPSQPPPPPPPHRTLPITRVAPPLPSGVPPQPPMRHSSIRNGANMNGDFETRFGDMFHSANEFPIPPPFRGVLKVYNSKTAKQQAPQPPITHLQLGNKMWARDTSTC